MGNKKGSKNKDVKPQQSILHFFQNQKKQNLEVIKVTCPGCHLYITKTMLNFHLDNECESKKTKQTKKKKNLKEQKKPREIILSDDDEDFDVPSNFFEETFEEEEDQEIFYSPSMVQTQIQENALDNPLILSLKDDWSSPEKSNGSPQKSNGSTQKANEFTSHPVANSFKDTTSGSNIHSNCFDDKIRLEEFNQNSNSSENKNCEITKSKSMEENNVKNGQQEIINLENDSEDDYDNFYEYSSRTKSPMLVSPKRSPSPTPIKHKNSMEEETNTGKNISEVKSTKGTPTSCKKSPFTLLLEKSPVKLSSTVKNNLNQFSYSKDLISYSKESSDQDVKPSKSPRTPRSVNKRLKNTSMLQNSPTIGTARRKLQLSQGTPDKNDKTRFRGIKGMYLDNFLHILDTVIEDEHNLELFNDEDIDIIQTFQKLSMEAQKLYVRLFQRKLKWNRAEKIEYKDICDKDETMLYINELLYAGFLLDESEFCFLDEVLNILNSDEIKALCKDLKIKPTNKKEDNVKAIIKYTNQPTLLGMFKKSTNIDKITLEKAKKYLDKCIIVKKEFKQVFMRVLMLYSLPIYDDDEDNGAQARLTTLLMVGLGKLKFPAYQVVRETRLFRNRDDLIRFEVCSQMENDIRDLMESHSWEEAEKLCNEADKTYQQLMKDKKLVKHDLSLPLFLRRFTSLSILVYILSCKVEILQKLRKYKEAVNQIEMLINQKNYLIDYRGRWYDRLALNLQQHLKNPKKTISVMKEALEDSEVRVGHRLSISIRAQRMRNSARFAKFEEDLKKLKILVPTEVPKVTIDGRCLPSDIPGQKRIFISGDSGQNTNDGTVTCCSVEELVLNHYKMKGYTEGLHKEGVTINSLFGLFFWDIIYAPIPDVFHSNHQAVPLDLDSPSFYTSRKDLIDERLDTLRNTWSLEDANNFVDGIWLENYETTSIVSWNVFRDLQHLQGLIASFGLPLIADLCERLSKDHRFTRSGFPDLIVWNPTDKTSRIIEVKGPNDRLSTKQILWLDYLFEKGATTEVCYVKEIGAKRIQKSPRKPMNYSLKKSPTKTPMKSPKKAAPKRQKRKKDIDSDEDFEINTKRKK